LAFCQTVLASTLHLMRWLRSSQAFKKFQFWYFPSSRLIAWYFVPSFGKSKVMSGTHSSHWSSMCKRATIHYSRHEHSVEAADIQKMNLNNPLKADSSRESCHLAQVSIRLLTNFIFSFLFSLLFPLDQIKIFNSKIIQINLRLIVLLFISFIRGTARDHQSS